MPESQDPKTLTAKDLYEQGSKTCQQYSQLTMQIRTLSQHVMIGYAVGLGLLFARSGSDQLPADYFSWVLTGAGIILIVFGCVLCLLNFHHSQAFRTVRNELVRLEEESKIGGTTDWIGPWLAHKKERKTNWKWSYLAWNSPFLALWLIGFLSLLLAVKWRLGKLIVLQTLSILCLGFLALRLGVFMFRTAKKEAGNENSVSGNRMWRVWFFVVGRP